MASYWGTVIALLIIYGKENINWLACLVDEVEWTDITYFHQN